MKEGNWEPIARGAADAILKIRSADEMLKAVLVAEPTKGATHTWASVNVLHVVRDHLALAMNDLTQGLKGRNLSIGTARRKVVK